MRLSEKKIPRRYNALANDWTPLSRKPCWLSIAFHCLRGYVKRNRFAWFHRLVISSKIIPTHHKWHLVGDKSFADDLVASGYCKYESNLCVTIYWDFCRVPSICSSLISDIYFAMARPRGSHFFRRGWRFRLCGFRLNACIPSECLHSIWMHAFPLNACIPSECMHSVWMHAIHQTSCHHSR